MKIGQRYILPLFLGFIGMFVCHFGLFICYQLGIRFMAYLIVYPIVYPILTIILTFFNSRFWLTNAIFLCAIPFIYWYGLLISDGRLNISDFSLFKSTGMSLIMIMTFGISVAAGFVIFKLKTYSTKTA